MRATTRVAAKASASLPAPARANTLTIADMTAIKNEVVGIKQISPALTTRTSISVGASKAFAGIEGVAPSFAQTYSWDVRPGKVFTDGASEAVIGRALADQMFGPGADPTGKTMLVRDASYQIVGVTSGDSEDHKDSVFIPYQKLQAALGKTSIDEIVIAAEKAGEASRIAEDVKQLLRKRHGMSGGQAKTYLSAQAGSGGTPDDFIVETQAAQALTRGLYTPAAAFALANLPKLDEVNLEEMADTLDHASDTMTALLASIAGVSLIVGGIGIMNIMLVSVTERTREIGLRIATGARSGDVAMQFLIEAVTLSVLGGVIGLFLGLASSWIIGQSLGWPVAVSAASMAMAMGISAAVGLIFGIYPRGALPCSIPSTRSARNNERPWQGQPCSCHAGDEHGCRSSSRPRCWRWLRCGGPIATRPARRPSARQSTDRRGSSSPWG